MALDQKFFKKSTAGSGTDQEQGLFIYADANDVDSYDGDGDLWYDINGHEVNIPLADKASNLQLHLNASDTTSYSGSGSTWTDISGNDRHGTITDPVFESGLAGGLDFNSATDANGDKVAVAHNAAFNQQNNMTFEVWVKRDGTTEDNIFYKGGASGNSYFLTYNPSWGYYFYTYAWAGGVYSGTSGLSTGVYEHVVVTIDGSGNRKMYVNGTLSANNLNGNTTGTGTLTDTGPLTIGGYYTYAAHGGFDGRISVVRIYNTVLTASEVGQNFRAGNNLSYSSTYDTNLALDFDPADIDDSASTATWTDKVASLVLTESGTADYNQELGNYVDLQGADYFGNDSATNTIKDSNGDFALDFWVNFNSTSGNNVILGVNQSSGVRGLMLYYGSLTMDLYVYKDGTTSGSMYGTPSWSTLGISTGEWYNIAIVTDASTNMKWYVNGILKATYTNNAGGSHWTNMHNIRIGDDATLGYDINAKIGNFKIYKGLLTDAQVTQNYLATKNKYPNSNNFTLYSPDFKNSSVPYYFRFNAANDEARISSVDIDISMGFTVSIYIKRHTAVSGYHQPFRITGTGYTNYLFLIAGHNDVIYYSSSGTGNSLSTYGNSGNWTDNSSAWRNIIFTRENDPAGSTTNRGEIYVNGSSHATATNLSAITNITNVYVNRDASYPTSRNAQCDVGLIKIWKKPFSDAEALAEYNATKDIYGL